MNFKTQLNKVTSISCHLTAQLHLQSTTLGERLIEFYIIAIFCISQLYLLDITILSMSMKTALFFLITLMTGAVYVMLIARRVVIPIRFGSGLNRCVLYMLILSMISMVLKLFSDDFNKVMNFESEVMIMTLLFSYLLVAGGGKGYRYYLWLLLTGATFVYAGLLFHYLVDPQWTGPMEYLFLNPQRIAAYLVLMTTISSLLYCTSVAKWQSIVSLFLSWIGYFLLFVTDNIISMSIVGVLFFVIPVIFVPTAELIKRNMHLFFLYFFLLSNMALVTNYFHLVKIELSYDIEFSIYIDLVLSVIAIISFHYWEKIPEGTDIQKFVLWRIQKAYQFALQFVGILCVTIFLTGEKLGWIVDKCGIEQIPRFIDRFRQYYGLNSGTLFDILIEYGWIGFVFLVILVITIIEQLKKCYCRENDMSVILVFIAIVFLVQSLFFSQQMVTTPIYIIVLTFALNAGQEKRREN